VTVGLVAEFNAMLWTAGFDFNYTSGYWEWNYDSGHQMDITSNSWGWVADQEDEVFGTYSLIYSAVSTPGFFNATHYPGVVICFSAGNAGPGYGTITPPSSAHIIMAGASTHHHTFEDAYGPDQGVDQIAHFSSRGPLFMGYSKPDVLAPGMSNYGLVLNYGWVFNIGPPFWGGTPTAAYGGTSMACPLVAGLAALILDAAPGPMTPDMVKTVIQNTADDTGMDGLSQGHGIINAWAAIDYVVNDVGHTF
jgi:subtilisin family serine protease